MFQNFLFFVFPLLFLCASKFGLGKVLEPPNEAQGGRQLGHFPARPAICREVCIRFPFLALVSGSR